MIAQKVVFLQQAFQKESLFEEGTLGNSPKKVMFDHMINMQSSIYCNFTN